MTARRAGTRAPVLSRAGCRALLGLSAAAVIGLTAARAQIPGDVAVFSGLDKITARVVTIEAPIGTPVRYGPLEITAHACNYRPPEETPNTTAFVTIREEGGSRVTRPGPQAGGDDAPALRGSDTGNDLAPGRGVAPLDEAFGGDAPAGEGEAVDGPAPVDGSETAGLETDAPADPDAPIFSGWMFASSPGLNALEHPVYDVWLIDCKTASGEASSGSAQ